ncbi:cupin domain-containing protein [Neorhizobium sp. NPDC001467]|uniref:cupin domain-containing protein n=1 Tax=Neorhizobium sp. NPDC001467 TaxID=3390595 RepID=UPI003D052D1D
MNRLNPNQMTIRRAGNAAQSPHGISTNTFWFENLVEGCGDGDLAAIRADLAPGTITKWHSHPQGQLLYVLSGRGLAQVEGGDVEELQAGDAVWFASGEKHWHGAAAHSSFSYLSVQPWMDGRNVDWFQDVEEPR